MWPSTLHGSVPALVPVAAGELAGADRAGRTRRCVWGPGSHHAERRWERRRVGRRRDLLSRRPSNRNIFNLVPNLKCGQPRGEVLDFANEVLALRNRIDGRGRTAIHPVPNLNRVAHAGRLNRDRDGNGWSGNGVSGAGASGVAYQSTMPLYSKRITDPAAARCLSEYSVPWDVGPSAQTTSV